MKLELLEYIVPGIVTFLALLFPAVLRTLVFDVSTFIVKSIWKVLSKPFPKKKQSKKNTAKIVQTLNPKTGKYVKIDREKGEIVSQKKTKGPYKGIPIVKK